MANRKKSSVWSRVYDALLDGVDAAGFKEAATHGRNRNIGQFEGQRTGDRDASPLGAVPTADLAYRRRHHLDGVGSNLNGYDADAWEDAVAIGDELDKRGVKRRPGFSK